MPDENVKTAVVRRQPGVASDLKDFIGACAQAKKAMSPDNLRANVGKFIGELPEDSRDLLQDLARLFRGPK